MSSGLAQWEVTHWITLPVTLPGAGMSRQVVPLSDDKDSLNDRKFSVIGNSRIEMYCKVCKVTVANGLASG